MNQIRDVLRQHGTLAGTAHARLFISEARLRERDLLNAGFVKVLVAVPESGQTVFHTFRHPEMLLHFHRHPGGWTVHEDRHPSSTMLMRKVRGTSKIRAFFSGMPHVFTEGIPGLWNYFRGLLQRSPNTAVRVKTETTPEGARATSRMSLPTIS